MPRKHHSAETRSYDSERARWRTMIARCTNAASLSFSIYGGRGITVCDRWRESFEAFREDVGPRPSAAHSLDRIDNDRGYEPGNVRWATRRDQARNRRDNHTLTLGGVTACITEWAERTSIPKNVLWVRITTLRWSTERALTEPVKLYRPRTRAVEA